MKLFKLCRKKTVAGGAEFINYEQSKNNNNKDMRHSKKKSSQADLLRKMNSRHPNTSGTSYMEEKIPEDFGNMGNSRSFDQKTRAEAYFSHIENYNRPMEETVVTTLPSGFRIATEDTKIPTATIGVWIDAGSRYENERNNGTAHFLEHMAFKGTSRRTRNALELEVENIGAHLNAYTSREQTVYYAKCFSTDLEQSVDILSDILLNSNLNPRDIEAERSVILREMQEVEQNFQEVVFDHLHTGVFEGNPLSMTILGPVENINSIQRNDLTEYIQTHYRSGRMVLSAAGGVVQLAEKYFGGLNHGDASANFHPAVYKPCQIHLPVDGMDSIYGAMVVEGVSWTHEDNLALMVANTLIGEWDRSRGFGVNAPSRLAVRLGRNAGVQSFQAFNTCYKDTGLIGVYFVAEESASEGLVDAVVDEWRWLANETARVKSSSSRPVCRCYLGAPPPDQGRAITIFYDYHHNNRYCSLELKGCGCDEANDTRSTTRKPSQASFEPSIQTGTTVLHGPWGEYKKKPVKKPCQNK
ncbi:peptidase, M16 family [Teladorsagia circumcincta]|uniref:Peptidase, M16 family n=1 Tax=Teladorsagia circumcincta TaxID=45464 RepID=A0A2G9U6F5_TELCI|nr:peptidase, M16 family [Teladorsagia circumcincta]